MTDTSKLTDGNIGVVSNGTDTLNIKLAKDLKVDSVTAGNTVINNNGLTVGGNTYVTNNGINANSQKITNVAAGTDGTDAVNLNQLNDVKNLAGKHTIVKVDGQENRTNGNLLITKTDNNGQATYDLKLNDEITVGKDGAAGKDGSIGVKGKDGSAVAINGKDGSIGLNGANGANGLTIKGGDGKPGVDGTNITRLVIEEKDGTKHDVATLDDGMKYGGDTGNVIQKKLNEQVNVIGGITDTNKLTTEDNLGVVSDGNNNLKVRMAKDLKGLNSVTTNTLTVGDVKIDNSGINAGNKKITNVAAGDISANSTDAVNGGQLWKTNQTINNIGGAVNELGTRVNRVGAGAAALAALHPLDFDPDDKWDVAAGYGNYKDAHAVSVGAFYRPNEDTMFSVGGSFGGGENMVNAGDSVKLGQGNHVSTSRVALAKEVEDLKAIVKAQSAEIKAMRGAMQSGTSVMKDVNFPDVPKDHWAYSYVKSLADRGLLEGYPDGEFKGDRSMTRYEFAAIIYRALQNGAPIDSDMAKAIGEFDPEINRIKDLDRTRVDRISGKDNDRHKVERVRVNNESNKEKGDYRDVYGSHISPEA